MRSIKKFFAVTLLALAVGLGTPTAFADGVAESPGMESEEIAGSPVEAVSQPAEFKGVAESPGFIDAILIYLDMII